ncbi:efflux RND transporter periplasmic adaptor subunit [Nitrosospira lacus]|uniref:Efflux transporter periplasmic adaptor subunit n=1 Tax=Nitrosospira lacus TaxID=1288494 RepID=A0A1W6SSC4_9PROT|nr:efflux RND transporter periplasmic adaptor subunit [Nitrosospira lacus]ARO88702.1 efflux RND transporter periplasmic adaptor subunit [Nitrosospira lacus]
MKDKNRLIPIIAVIAIGIAVGGLILTLDKSAPSTAADTASKPSDNAKVQSDTASDRGPRGGKLLTTDNFGVEVTIFEQGVPPQFRLYLYKNDKPLSPSAAKITVTLTRLGTPAQVIKFTPEADYLIGDQTIEEPHSFDVVVSAQWDGKTFRWNYSQVEMRVKISNEMLKSMGIEILTAEAATIKPTLKLPGEIIFNEHTIVQVVPRLPGIVTAVYRHHGQHVKKGEVLAVIESQMLAELRSQHRVARKRLALAQTTFEREKRLWEEKITAKQDYLIAQELLNEAEIAVDLASVKLRSLGVRPDSGASEENLARYEIQAPISGLITAKAIAQGQTLKDDANIYTIADVSTVWAAITVYPKDLAVIEVGQRVTVKATAFDVEGEGAVTYITTLIGGQTRTATARVELENEDGRWRPGMFVNAELVTEDLPVPVAVSADAIQTIRDWTVVFGRYGQFFEARPLELGRGDGKMIEVLKGLRAGEQYAAGNSFAIKAELGKSGASHDH